ncbi:MAG: hypothetical protein COV52_07050 [Gammaproteobacteria bacterium CG11_big_fil_rev_8_21_14_0_20_46_22]|nr:MAG: hypothetical protein COW05_06075 [Gammaproteobacteria bacterium CG12_big_fil_rev_8_21_14_0_65_46_12]PIR10796.1 MAG: hypothetical protein COV52_07050 [Gammaproteobacteria bacterium CG11_big_fil_rev_8_21_14_0_20_46_22]
MSETVEGLTISYHEDGVEKIKELDKALLAKGGAWVTMMFRYQEWDYKAEAYGPDKFAVRRYQKRNGAYQMRSKFNISNVEQAKKIIEILAGWTA